jgi:hypothetical protein
MIKSKYLNPKEYVSSKMQKKMRNLVYYQTKEFRESKKRNSICPRCGKIIDVLDDVDIDHINPFRNIAGAFIDSYKFIGGNEDEFYESVNHVTDFVLHQKFIDDSSKIELLEMHSRGDKQIEDVLHWVSFHDAASTFAAMHRECHRAKSKEKQ